MRRISIGNRLTKKDTKSITSYLNELKRSTPLDPEVEYGLALAASKGDEAAKVKLIESNLKFVVSVAKQYQTMNLPIEDLINEGNIGLIVAANNFDPTRGFKFITYAVWHIRQKIQSYIYNNENLIRVPYNKVSIANVIKKRLYELEQRLERPPMYDEIMDELKGEFNKVDIEFFLNKEMLSTISLDTPSGFDGDNNSLIDIIKNTNNNDITEELDDKGNQNKINQLLSNLTDKESLVLHLLYGFNGSEPLTPEEVAQELKVTKQVIYQTKKRALKKLKDIPIKSVKSILQN